MTLTNVSTIFGMLVILGGAGAAGGDYYLETKLAHYVPISALEKSFIQRDIRNLKRELRKLERIPDPSDQEVWEQNDLEDEIEYLEDQL